MNNLYKIGVFAFLLLTGTIYAQENRILETKVADILAQYPAKTNEYADQLSQKIVDLKGEGITQFTDMLLPIGQGNDTQVRYALESLARYCAAPGTDAARIMVEKAFLDALEKAEETEVKTFLIRRLHYCATDASIPAMGALLSNPKLASPAIGVLTSIGTLKAGAILLSGLEQNPKHIEIIKALGVLKYDKAVPVLNKLAGSTDVNIEKEALYALSKIANPSSWSLLTSAVAKAEYKITDNDATISYIEYARNLGVNGNSELSRKACDEIIKNTNSEEQLHLRTAAFSILRTNFGGEITKSLLNEAKKTSNKKYRQAIFNEASKNMTSNEVKLWLKLYKKLSNEGKGQLLYTLATRKEQEILTKGILPAINDKDILLKQEAIKALVVYQKEKAVPTLAELLKTSTSEEVLNTIYEALLISLTAEESNQLVDVFDTYPLASKKITLALLKEKNATQHFDFVAALTKNAQPELQREAYKTIPNVSSKQDVQKLIDLLALANENQDIENVQNALFSIVFNDSVSNSKVVLVKAFESGVSKHKLLPVIPAINSKQGLEIIKKELNSSDAITKKAAVKALLLWKSEDVLPYLYDFISSSNENIDAAFAAYLSKVNTASIPNDQKLLLIRRLEPFVKSEKQTIQIIEAAGKIKTFLSLMFASSYMDDEPYAQAAMHSVISIVLPKPGDTSKFSGKIVRETIEKIIENLKGNDSQYVKIDLNEFLGKMSDEEGYVSIFNGKDLSGWEGLVKNPIERERMSKKVMERAQANANKQMLKDWFVKDGVIGFRGEGYNNISTIKDYGDFEMLVDWKITNGGDSGIYLRGTPQVQIWDTARTDVGAEVGSGGLYNNKKHRSTPLVVADNPIDEWNTFRIKMVGDQVTVHLNGVLVTDHVVLENYWDRTRAIFTKEAIELQAHGEDLGFRNIYVREIHSDDSGLTKEEKEDGFISLFNGKNLDQWKGNKTDYIVEDNLLAVRPKQGGHGNLYTSNEYSDFIFRFEFQLTPGANNGLGIHAPLKGDAAYVGKELQILDNSAPIYKNLKPYQYHGSVYGIIAAKKGHLKPVGEWNIQEVIVKGDDIKITLNGVVIVNGNIKEASKNGTADHKDHSGLKRNKGHIGFLGHGSELQFRNIRIKDLSK